MNYEILETGLLHRCPTSGPDSVAATSRPIVTRDGDVLCSFHLQSGLGVNDFAPCLSRSTDGGKSWKFEGITWPHLREKYSINCSISKAPNGDLFRYGFRMPITRPGESFWCPETQGILPNQLIWSRSTDSGRNWTEPSVFEVPLPGAAETPGSLCVTSTGRWIAPYSPHHTFDPNLEVDVRHTVLMISDDEGRSWRHQSMMRVKEDHSCIATSWVTELGNGSLLSACCHLNRGKGSDFPNPYTMSFDHGDTWMETGSTGIMGQSEGIAAWGEKQALFVYNQRRCDTPGIWLAVAEPSSTGFGVLVNKLIWSPAVVTQNGATAEFDNWTSYSFGEPAVTVLPDRTVFVAFWCLQPQERGIGYVRLRIV